MTRRTLLLALAASLPAGASAQNPPPGAPRPGSAVRVVRNQPDGRRAELVRGRLERLSGDTASIRLALDSIVRVPFGGDRVLEVGVAGEGHTAAGALVGVFVGGAVGYAAGADSEPECPQGCMFEGVATASSAGLGILVGGVLGALIGSQIRATNWVPAAAAARVGVGVVPAAGGLGVRVDMHF